MADFRGFLNSAAQGGDANAKTALNWVGNDGNLNPDVSMGIGPGNAQYLAQYVKGQFDAYNASKNAPKAGNGGGYQAPGGSGGAGGANNSAGLAQLADQESLLNQLLGRSGTLLNQGLTQIGDDYNHELSSANTQRSRALEDFQTKQTQTELAKNTALDRTDTNARTLANSIRQRIGQASGSGSSAYQIVAPQAIAREASQNRQGVQENYAQNFQALDTAKKRAGQDFDSQLSDLTAQKQQKEKGLQEGILTQEQGAYGSLADIARQRAALQGGGVGAIRAASAPYQAQVSQRQAAIDNLFNQYRTPYTVKPVNVQAPNLSDYVVNGSKIGNNAPQAQTQTDILKKQLQDQQYNPLLG
jgi:hypothetical protein